MAECFFFHHLHLRLRVAELELELDQVDREIRHKNLGGFLVDQNLYFVWFIYAVNITALLGAKVKYGGIVLLVAFRKEHNVFWSP